MAADTTVTPEHKRSTVRPDKAQAVADIAEAFRTSQAAVLTEYRGLTVKQITALRVALGDDTTYTVVKNTLTTLAAGDAGLTGMDELLSGPTAVAFIKGDPVEAAKSLRDFGRANPQLVVKGGVMDGKPLTADEVRRLADLESREVLLSKMAGALLASLSNAVYLFNAPLQQVARLAGALQEKATEDPSIIGGAGTAAADLVEAAVTAETEAPGASDEATAAPEVTSAQDSPTD
ncbi:MAG: ribosomal protein [Frankiales bacterium]|jgi:large subunit ribosomal protein L10|nr:ribosomal protein [Frankiales bacterium]